MEFREAFFIFENNGILRYLLIDDSYLISHHIPNKLIFEKDYHSYRRSLFLR